MHFDWWTLALQIVNFGILVWLLHRFLYKPVLRMIDARKAEIEKQFADVRAAEDQAKTALAAVDAERAGIAAERAAALKAAAVQAEEAATARRGQAEREAAALLDGARETIAKEREQALAEARRVALDLGVEVARKLLDEVPTELRAEAWLERVEQHLATLAPAEREELRKGLDGSGAVRAVTATPLPEPVITEWRNAAAQGARRRRDRRFRGRPGADRRRRASPSQRRPALFLEQRRRGDAGGDRGA